MKVHVFIPLVLILFNPPFICIFSSQGEAQTPPTSRLTPGLTTSGRTVFTKSFYQVNIGAFCFEMLMTKDGKIERLSDVLEKRSAEPGRKKAG